MDIPGVHLVGIVVVHYRRETELTALLNELVEMHGVPDESIVIVNNGADEPSMERARQRHSNARWIDLPNVGYGAGVNAGVDRLPSTVSKVLVLTHEVTLEEGTIGRLANHLATHPNVGMVGPLMMQSGSDLIWSAGGMSRRLSGKPYNSLKGQPAHLETGERAVEWLDGSCFMMRVDDFHGVGGHFEPYFLYFEDVDLGWRVRNSLGKSVVCLTAARAAQSPGGHLDQFFATRNLTWLLWRKSNYFRAAFYILESAARLLLGFVFRPKGALSRQRLRLAGLQAAISGLTTSRSNLSGKRKS